MKYRILQVLQQSPDPVSGTWLSRQLGISRVAVWKHIRSMIDTGCTIHSGPKGYHLSADPDVLEPWAFGARSDRVHHFSQLPSTMEPAAALALKGCDRINVVVADVQTRGRGRLDRQWMSARGGLYFTMVFKPDLEPRLGPLVNLAAALDLVKTLEILFDIRAQVKWPNDVLVHDAKIAGILSQTAFEADRVQYICLGMGVNVNNQPPDISPPAVSVAGLTGKPASRRMILSRFWDEFEHRVEQHRFEDVVTQWKCRSATLGRKVIIQTPNETIQGKAMDMDDQGGLILALPGGEHRTVLYGDCLHPRGDGSDDELT